MDRHPPNQARRTRAGTLGLALCATALTVAPADALTGRLVASWTFEGDAADGSDNGHHGTLRGVRSAPDQNQRWGEAYEFDGIDDSIELDSRRTLTPMASATIAAWIRPEGNRTPLRLLPIFSDARTGLHLFWIFDPNGVARLGASATRGGDPARRAKLAPVPEGSGRWLHVAAVFDDGDIRLYVDGLERPGEYGNPDELPASRAGSSAIGRRGSHFFEGAIAEIAWWPSALPPTEIASIYAGSALTADPTPPVLASPPPPRASPPIAQSRSVLPAPDLPPPRAAARPPRIPEWSGPPPTAAATAPPAPASGTAVALVPPPFNAVDAFKESLSEHAIVFNVPQKVEIDDVIHLRLMIHPRSGSLEDEEQMLIEAFEEARTEATVGEHKAARARVGAEMLARLSSASFQISVRSPEQQALGSSEATVWEWDVKAIEPGTHTLVLELSAIMPGTSSAVRIKTYEEKMLVEVPPERQFLEFASENWEWMWTLIAPAGGWIYARRRRRARSA